MDSENLSTYLDYISSGGFMLSLEQRSALQSSLTLLKHHNKFYKVYFWGKIVGVKDDVLIAQGVNIDQMKDLKTFYSKDCLTWALLPMPNEEMMERAGKVTGRFIGDLSHEYEVTETKKAVETDVSEEAPEEEETINVKEEERLACIIAQIDAKVRIVPRGAFVRTPENKVVENRSWEGLDVIESAKLESFYHFRKPTELPKKSLLERAEQDRALDFLDDISGDIPKGTWSLQFERGSGLLILRNLTWQGYTFFLVPGSGKYGSIYAGTGEPNIDLPFML